MATFALFDDVVKYLLDPAATSPHTLTGGPVNFETKTFRVALSNPAIGTTEQAASSFTNDITQIAGSGGYTQVTTGAGATAANPAVSEPSSGVWQFTTDDITFSATPSTMATFRYPGMICTGATNATSSPVLIGFLDYGSGVSLAKGNSFIINVGTNGWFQISVPNFA